MERVCWVDVEVLPDQVVVVSVALQFVSEALQVQYLDSPPVFVTNLVFDLVAFGTAWVLGGGEDEKSEVFRPVRCLFGILLDFLLPALAGAAMKDALFIVPAEEGVSTAVRTACPGRVDVIVFAAKEIGDELFETCAVPHPLEHRLESRVWHYVGLSDAT